MVILKSDSEIANIREAGRACARALLAMEEALFQGTRCTADLDAIAKDTLERCDATPSLVGYTPPFTTLTYNHATCISHNDLIVHGVPSHKFHLSDGDVVSFDVVAQINGYHADAAISVAVGTTNGRAKRLIEGTRKVLNAGIKQAVSGNRIGDISYAIQASARERGFGVVAGVQGHGIGTSIHEAPDVPNWGRKNTGLYLVPGMVICIEPMLTLGAGASYMLDDDPWGVRTLDGSWAAHFEHTVAITESGPQILTQL